MTVFKSGEVAGVISSFYLSYLRIFEIILRLCFYPKKGKDWFKEY